MCEADHVYRFGYVDVKPEDVDKALELSGKELNGEPIRIDKSKPKNSTQEEGRGQGGEYGVTWGTNGDQA